MFRERWFSKNTFKILDSLLHGDEAEFEQAQKWFLANMYWSVLEQVRTQNNNRDLNSFFQYAISKVNLSNAQLLQDLWVLFQTYERSNGFFVEIGACDGIFLSNTYLLEKKFGWRGILVEPNPKWHQELQKNRNCGITHKCAYVKSGIPLEFSVTTHPELSRISNIMPQDIHEKKWKSQT